MFGGAAAAVGFGAAASSSKGSSKGFRRDSDPWSDFQKGKGEAWSTAEKGAKEAYNRGKHAYNIGKGGKD